MMGSHFEEVVVNVCGVDEVKEELVVLPSIKQLTRLVNQQGSSSNLRSKKTGGRGRRSFGMKKSYVGCCEV